MSPVTGRVTLDGEPLEFGYVVFQPKSGQPAKGAIGSDGRFTLTTEGSGEGALLGPQRICVYCYEGHRPGAASQAPGDQMSLGRSLIPAAYSRGGMSGLTAEVPPEGLEGHTIALSSKGPRR